MENYNFYQVQGWMVNELHLRGNELICYAIIYSFSQDEESKFMGGVKYLCGWMNASEPTVISILNKLSSKGLIEPITVITKTCKRVYYQVTKESLVRGNLRNLSKVTKESLVSLYNNNNNNKTIKEKVDDKTSTKKRFVKPTIDQIAAYINEKNLHFDAEGFYDYYESKGWLVGKSPMKDWKAACRTWEHNRKSIDKKEESKEEDEPINLPAGMTADQWKRIGLWMCVEIPSIAGKISPMDFYEMKKLVDGNSEQLRDILKDINEYVSENGSLDVLEFFREIVRSNEAGNGHE